RMVIDNTAGLIPVPASEIEISRAVYRSGESEYRLGGRPCRLLDIQELLSDTGIGRAMHTLIGQGHLEDVLAARPEDRRQFVEEARSRAREGLRSLDGTVAAADEERSSTDELAAAAGAAHVGALTRKSDAEGRLRAAIRSESGARERLGVAVNASGRLFALEE